MKQKAAILVSLVLIAVIAIVGCGTQQSRQDIAKPPRVGYTEASLPLHANDEGAPDTVAVRFYDDMPNVPYIGLAHYMALVFGDNASIESRNGVALITATDGGTAIVDDMANTITSDSWSTFHNYLAPMKEGKRQGFADAGAPFCRISSLDYEPQREPVTFDFSRYDIDLHVDGDDAFLPLATASDLMSDIGYNNLAYNGEELCLVSGFLVSPTAADPGWYDPIASDVPRDQDVVDFTYAELCFVFDNIYSCSGKGLLDKDIASKGLDAALAEKDDLTLQVRELIKSTDKADYLLGLTMLGNYVMNLHTNLSDAKLQDQLEKDGSIAKRVEQGQDKLVAEFLSKDYGQEVLQIARRLDFPAKAKRNEVWSDGERYHEQGDTAVISLDNFTDFDRKGWAKHYQGTGPQPDGSSAPDVVGTLLAGLERANANPEIRNVVIDVSANGGGLNDLCITAAAVLTGMSTTPARDLSTGQRFNIAYDIDSLFDGTFDAAAMARRYDFNYAVLTSEGSFSCGNYFASLMHDAGIPVIGETSGGGTDMVMRMVSPDGQCFQMTDRFAQMTDAGGNSIEDGITPDVELVTFDENGQKDYSALYDIARLSDAVNGYYASEAMPAAA